MRLVFCVANRKLILKGMAISARVREEGDDVVVTKRGFVSGRSQVRIPE